MGDNPKTRILIVDDDITLLEMYKERLSAEGFEVITAANGEEGLARAVDMAPQLILLDLMMPKVNGFDVLDIIKTTPETKNTPVIILSALIQDTNKQRGLKAGAAGYIVKSETMPKDVIEKIKSVLEKNKEQIDS